MPFENERAGYAPLRRILQSEKVRRLQARFRLVDPTDVPADAVQPMTKQLRDESVRRPDLILAIDGGYAPAEVNTGYPGAEIGYVTVAAVLILLDKLREVSAADIIDPVEHRRTQRRSSIDTALPGRGVILDDEATPEASMRRTLFDEMAAYRVFDDSETLLDTFEALMEAAPDDRTVSCPCERRCPYRRAAGRYACDQPDCDTALYSTDAMRLHELFSPHESCRKLYGHVMTTLERLWLLHALRAFERRGPEWLAVLGRMAFVVDGPLAFYGTPAWLSSPVRRELARINAAQRCLTKRDMMIIGIEKTGAFANHFEMLDVRGEDGEPRFPNESFLLLTDEYIRRHIVPSVERRQYGRNTYFGRKVLYKSALGHRLVVNVACFSEEQQDLSTAGLEQFPRFADAMTLLDEVSSNLYPNSVSPLIAANSEASIPLNLGKRILEDIARKALADG